MNLVHKAFHFIENGHPSEKEVAYALLFVRIATAVFFITHGYSKIFGEAGVEGFAGMLSGIGLPLAALFAWLVAIAELFGGIAILLGVFTRFSAFWLTIIAFVAWASVKGFGLGMGAGDIDILAMGLTLALFFAGPGKLSVSHKMNANKVHEQPEEGYRE